MAKKEHAGSSFDVFLREEGLHAQASARALKRVRAWQEVEAIKQAAEQEAVGGLDEDRHVVKDW